MTPERFLLSYPEFAGSEESTVRFWLDVAHLLVTHIWSDIERCGSELTMRDLGRGLFAAHHIVLERQALDRAKLGGPPGIQVGVLQAVAVNGANVSYDTQAAADPDDGHWNLTTYGMRFIRLAKMVGSFPVQIGIGRAPFGAGPFVTTGPAWSGPWTFLVPNPQE